MSPSAPGGRDPARPGAMRPIGPAGPVVAAVVGAVLGWLVRPVATALSATPPLVPWGSAVVLGVVAGVLLVAARATRRTLADPAQRLEPHRGVNRLVMARACLVAGAFVAGAYAGYATSWLGLATELAEQRLLRSAVCAGAAAAVVVASVLLERACRTGSGSPDA